VATYASLREALTARVLGDARRVFDEVLRETRLAAPGGPNGRIARTTRLESVTVSATGARAVVVSELPEARYTDEGTRPHPIVARGRALAFPWRGQRVVFFKRVMHPGNAPQRWFRVPMQARLHRAVQAEVRRGG
jgi:hypothetical protein